MPCCACVYMTHHVLQHLCHLSEVALDTMPESCWMACSVELYADCTSSSRAVKHGGPDRCAAFPSRWLDAAAVSAGKERLNFLTLHVVEVRSWPGLGSGMGSG